MRQESVIKTYAFFNELSNQQKKKELEKYRYINTDDNWFSYVEDNFKEKLSTLGYSNVKTYFSGFSSQGDGACFTATKNNLEIAQSGRYYHDMTMQCDDKDLLEEARELAREYYKDLEKEYDSLTSDQAIIESLEANDFEFEVIP